MNKTYSPDNMFFNKITILGVGLIGASFALAMKKSRLCKEVTGYGRREENLKKAQSKKIIDTFELDPVKACNGSDLILFATPVGSFIDIAKNISGSLKKGTIVTDVGSVAGSNHSGMDTASEEIFNGVKCIITPTGNTDKSALEKVIALWKSFGSVIKLINPDEHDRIYASVSHLPHLIAYVIVNTVADIDSSYLNFSGQGFMDTTRIASSSPELWRDICILNKDNLLESLEIFKKNLDRVSQYLRVYDSESLEKDFKKARTFREGIGQN
jgi:prephenate dehydrogenase